MMNNKQLKMLDDEEDYPSLKGKILVTCRTGKVARCPGYDDCDNRQLMVQSVIDGCLDKQRVKKLKENIEQLLHARKINLIKDEGLKNGIDAYFKELGL